MTEIFEKVLENIRADRIENACELLKEIESSIGDIPELLNAKAVLHMKSGEYGAALSYLKAALELSPNNVDIYYNLAFAYQSLKDVNEALAIYGKILGITNDSALRNEILKIAGKLEEGQEEKYSSDDSLVGEESQRDKEMELIVINTDNIDPPREGNGLFESRSNVGIVKRSRNAPLVSIVVTGYNRIDKTRRCVDSLLKYADGIDYELILLDNGSSDGTLDFFKSVKHKNKKVIRVTRNFGGGFASILVTPYVRGKYYTGIANDMVLTKNWLANLLKCCEQDKRVGMAVPASSNVSNFQEVKLSFSTLDEMQEKAAIFNVSDPRKWHEKLRLATIAPLVRTECLDVIGGVDYGFFHEYGDDDLSFRMRRAGYKLIFCKDVFIHHDHEQSTSDEKKFEVYKKSLETGRMNFREKYYGIDAWNDVNEHEPGLVEMAKPPKRSSGIEILGIDVKCGSPILELKNHLKSYDLFDARLSAFFADAKYHIDLHTICEGSVICSPIDFIAEKLEAQSFDYILLGRPLNIYENPFGLLRDIWKLLKADGQILLKLRNTCDIRTFLNSIGTRTNTDTEYPIHLPIEDLHRIIMSLGGQLGEVKAEAQKFDEHVVVQIVDFVKRSQVGSDLDAILKHLLVDNYLLEITKCTTSLRAT